ncbi:MAG: glycosyltransferase family 4 protein [Comamonadaceae bacterium]|jgi:glycosyltransferase involved in cell wall biosynthesis|nr:glycosyltransferase family 4 protein [Comamonadaceae bacterium]
MTPHYTLITPRLDATGPCNVAAELAQAALARGWRVSWLYLSPGPGRPDLAGLHEVRRFRLADCWQLHGLVHTHCLRPDLLGALLAGSPRRTVITTVHNNFLADLRHGYAAWKVGLAWTLWRRAVARLDRRFCVSRASQRHYARLAPELRFDVAYNFRAPTAAAELAAPVASWLAAQRAAGRTVLAFVGTLSTLKNVAALLQALSAAPGLALILCGDGPLRAALAAAAAGLGERVCFAGHVAQPGPVLEQVDALVLPSLTEGLPLVVVEALRAGCPSLLSNIAVHRELAALGAGLTFDHRRFTDFPARLDALLGRATPEHRAGLKRLWDTRFSPAAGFAPYAALAR